MRASRLPLLSLLLLALGACAAGKGALQADHAREEVAPASQADRQRVARLRQEVEATLRARTEGLWSRWIGAAEEARAATGATRAPPSVEELQALRRVRGSSEDPDERRALGHLERYLIGELLAARTAEVAARIRQLEASITFADGDREHALDEVGRILAREPDSARRSALARAFHAASRRLSEEQGRREAILQEVARELGHRDLAGLAIRRLAGEEEALATLAERILEETEPIFRRALGEAARRELGMGLGELRRADLPRLFAGATFEVRLPPRGAWEAARRTFEGMGLALEGVAIDAEERPEKAPLPACFPVDPPGDVRLSLAADGARDWRPLLRAVGCAAQSSRHEAGAFEDRALGPAATAAAFGFLYEALAEDPAWLRANTELTRAEIEAQLAGVALQQLFVVRRAAGRFLFDRLRHQEALEGAELEEAYREALERAFLFRVDEPGAARIFDHRLEPFASADLFQARLLAAALEAELRALHGASWWMDPAAGQTLSRLHAQGIHLAPEEVARSLGEEALPLAPFLERIEARLKALEAPPLPPPPEEAPEELPPLASRAAPADQGARRTRPLR